MNDKTTNNPLAHFFRQPAMHLKLPSNGQFWKEDALNLPVTGEVPIYPMTTSDEITLRTPDALLNGAGVVSVIKSCCPCINDPWFMPSIDVDAILIAIRIASYGQSMDIEAKCPKCNEENTYQVNLHNVLENITSPDYTKLIEINDLKIKLQPQPYFSVNKTNMVTFEEQRILQTINDDTLDDEVKTAKFNEHLKRLVELNSQVIVDSTASIQTPDGQIVTNKEHITEFYQQVDRKVVKTVRNWLEEAANVAAIRPVAVACSECGKEFNLTVTFDYANFFA